MRILVVTQAVDADSSTLGFFVEWLREFSGRCERVDVIALSVGRHGLPANVRVVSMPSMEIFARQPKSYQEEVLPSSCAKRVSIEAGVTISWGRYVGTAGKAIGTDTFGLSAPGDVVMKELGITKEAVVNAAKAL